MSLTKCVKDSVYSVLAYSLVASKPVCISQYYCLESHARRYMMLLFMGKGSIAFSTVLGAL